MYRHYKKTGVEILKKVKKKGGKEGRKRKLPLGFYSILIAINQNIKITVSYYI